MHLVCSGIATLLGMHALVAMYDRSCAIPLQVGRRMVEAMSME